MTTRNPQWLAVFNRPGRGQICLGVFQSRRNAAFFRDSVNRIRESDTFGPCPLEKAVIRKVPAIGASALLGASDRGVFRTDLSHADSSAPHPSDPGVADRSGNVLRWSESNGFVTETHE